MSKTKLTLLKEKYDKRDPLEFNEQEDHNEYVVNTYYNKEKELIENYSKQLKELNNTNGQTLNKYFAKQKVNQKNLDEYLKIKGLNQSDYVVDDLNKSLEKYYLNKTSQNLENYKTQVKEINDSYEKSLKEIYTKFDYYYDRPYKNTYTYENVAKFDTQNNNYVMSDGTKFVLGSAIHTEIANKKDFKEAMQNDGFTGSTDKRIPNGYVLKLTEGYFNQYVYNYVYVDGVWYNVNKK